MTNKRNCFEDHENDCLKKATKYADMIYSIVQTASYRILIGKTFWKSIAMLPSFMYATEILEYNENELQQLQTLDNNVQACTEGGGVRMTPPQKKKKKKISEVHIFCD